MKRVATNFSLDDKELAPEEFTDGTTIILRGGLRVADFCRMVRMVGDEFKNGYLIEFYDIKEEKDTPEILNFEWKEQDGGRPIESIKRDHYQKAATYFSPYEDDLSAAECFGAIWDLDDKLAPNWTS